MFILLIVIFLLSIIFSTYIQLRIKSELRNNNYCTNVFNNQDLRNLLNLIKSENNYTLKKYYKKLLFYQFLGIVISLIGFSLIIYFH